MLKQKCPDCAEKISKKYHFCPWCGSSIRQERERESFGLLGRNDRIDNRDLIPQNTQQLPFGLDKIIGGLMKQLEREFSQMNKEGGMPKGFNIKIQTSNPQQLKMVEQKQVHEIPTHHISETEHNRRLSLPKQEAESKIKRLSDRIIYEINVPGIKRKEDILITKLEQGFEIKAYTKEYCYTKTIPLQIEIIGFIIKDNKLIVELKN